MKRYANSHSPFIAQPPCIESISCEPQAAAALAIAPDVDEVEAVSVSNFSAEDDFELSFEVGEEVRAQTCPPTCVFCLCKPSSFDFTH